MLNKMKKNKRNILLFSIVILIVFCAVLCIKIYHSSQTKNTKRVISQINTEENDKHFTEYKYKENVDDFIKKQKIEELINISDCTEEFMEKYFEDVQELQNIDNKENIVIVTSEKDIENTYGATKTVKAPNNQYFLQYKNEKEKNNALEKFSNSKEILYAGKNIIYKAYGTGYNSWGIQKMGLDNAITVSDSNDLNEVTVAIIDSGCNVSLIENNYPGKINGTYNALTSGTDVTDGSGHGTHIAGTIAEGTPSNVKILPIKVSNNNNNPNYFSNIDIIVAINYIVYNQKAQVINMSFGSEYDQNLFVALTAAYKNNIICVAAAGNASTSIPSYPAGYSNTISISAIDSDFNLASYSNYGETITFSAPGTDILSVNGLKSGTSMATPHAVCAVAILKSFYPEYTMEQVINELEKYTIDLGTDGWDEKFGYGLIHFDVDSLEELNEGSLFKENATSIKKIEIPDFIVKNNYGTISNILNAEVNIYYTNDDFYTKALWELKDFEILNYNPYDYTQQTLTLRYKGKECNFNVDNGHITNMSWSYEIIDEEQGYINITAMLRNESEIIRKVYVPETINGYIVKEIGNQTFSNHDINYVSLPKTVTKINDFAFYCSYSLETLEIYSEEIYVGNQAFSNCINLKGLNPKINYIGEQAFRGCENLKNISFSDSLVEIPASAFYGCANLENLYIPKSVESIGLKAFYNCSGLKSILVHQDNPIYDSREKCNALIETETNRIIQGSINTVIPNSIRIIGSNSYRSLNIKEIIIPEGVEIIEFEAFYDPDYNIEQVFLPRTIISMTSASFTGYGFSNTKFWVYRDSYAELSLKKDSRFTCLYRNENIYDIVVTLSRTNFSAFETLGINDISISLVYNDGGILTYESYFGDVYLGYLNNNNYLSAGDEYIIIGILDGTRMILKDVPVNVSKITPEYEIPENLTGKTNTLLSSVVLPEKFRWTNPNQKITEVGVQTFKAKYIPGDNNYEIIENIDINVTITKGKELIIPNITIENKQYDGTTNIDLNSITISNLNNDEYAIKKVALLNSDAGNKKVAVTLKLSDNKFEQFTFDNCKQEKEFTVEFIIDKAQLLVVDNTKDVTVQYDEEEHTLELDLQYPDYYTLKYMDSNEEYVLDDIPKYIEPGIHVIKYKVFYNNNYEEYFGEKKVIILSNELVLGDVNADGTVNVIDYTMIIRYLKGYEQLDDIGLLAADVNKDGTVNVIDYTKLIRYLKGYETLD